MSKVNVLASAEECCMSSLGASSPTPQKSGQEWLNSFSDVL